MKLTLLESEPLDSDKIKLFINPENRQYLAQLDIFDQINSTNAYLLECAKTSRQSGWVCFANQQSSGRGRLGRSWFSPPGANIYCSLLYRFQSTQTNLSALSLAVAVMVVNALRRYGIHNGLELKWPNDILYAGRKLGGILLERLPEKEDEIAIVIGIGINLKLPEDENRNANWIDVTEITHQPIARNFLAGLLVNELLVQLPLYQQQGVRAFLDEWEKYDCLKDKLVTVHLPNAEKIGMAQGINMNGELIIKTETDVLNFQCGEVSVRTGSGSNATLQQLSSG